LAELEEGIRQLREALVSFLTSSIQQFSRA